MIVLAPLALLVAGLPGLSLELSAPETAVLVGEPVKVAVRWKATSDLRSLRVEDPEFLRRSLQFVVDGPPGPRRYVEQPRARVEMLDEPGPLAAGREMALNYVLLDGVYATPGGPPPISSFLFPAAGTYSLRAVYVARGTTDVLAQSNAVTFRVSAPGPGEAAVRAALGLDPRMRAGGGDIGRLKALVQENPRSRYLRRAKAAIFERRANDLHNRWNPDTGESLWVLDAAALASYRATQFRAMAEDLMADGDWGAFDEERLLLTVTYARAGGALGIAQRARDEILSRFPRSPSAQDIRAWEAEMADPATEDGGKPRP
jgi:hypothetical protein